MECGFRVNMADNGFVLEYEDPEIRQQNHGDAPWQDPWRKRVYSTVEALTADISALIPVMAAFAAKRDEKENWDDNFKSAINQAFNGASE